MVKKYKIQQQEKKTKTKNKRKPRELSKTISLVIQTIFKSCESIDSNLIYSEKSTHYSAKKKRYYVKNSYISVIQT